MFLKISLSIITSLAIILIICIDSIFESRRYKIHMQQSTKRIKDIEKVTKQMEEEINKAMNK